MNDLKIAVPASSRAEKVQKVVAPCGVEAWLVEDYAVPIVALDLAFGGGSSQDPQGKGGATTMLSALLDEGAGDLDGEAFHRALDDDAIELSFSANRDIVSGHMRTLAAHASNAFHMLGLAIQAPRLDGDSVERVRAQLLAGLKRETNDPDSLAARTFRAIAFPDHPYGLPGRGDLTSVAHVTRADLVGLHRSIFARDNVKIAVVGAINAKTLEGLLESSFGPLPAQNTITRPSMATLQGVGTRQVVDIDLSQSTLRFGRPGISRKDPDFMAAVVANHILGGGVFSARLFLEVREKRGLAYTVYSQLASFDHADILMGATSTKNERALESLEVIQAEIRAIGRDGPSLAEVEKARKYLVGSYALRFDTSTKIAGQLVGLQLEGYDVSYLDNRNRLIESVTLEDAVRASARLFGDGELLVVAAGRPVGMA